MKKIILPVMLLCLVLCGCSKNSDNITKIDTKKVSTIIEKKLKNMKSVDKDELEDVYGLDTKDMKTIVIKENNKGDLYAIIESKNIDDTKEKMEDYFEKVKEFNQSYSPERLKILENRVEREIGNYLIYIVSKDAEDIYDSIVKSL